MNAAKFTHRRLTPGHAPHGWVAITPRRRSAAVRIISGAWPAIARRSRPALVTVALVGMFLVLFASVLRAQAVVPIRDLVIANQAPPVRLVGYGLVTGLPGTGDQTNSGRNSAHTVQSVANLLRRFDISVPPELLRTRNVAAVLVTAEVSPYLRAGGRFDVQVASVGDARSLRGGVLWMTPLITEAGGQSYGTAQGAMVVDDNNSVIRRRIVQVEASGRILGGGVLVENLPRPSAAPGDLLLLREPDLGTAARIAAVIDSVMGEGAATVEDPGAVALSMPDSAGPGGMARVLGLVVEPVRPGRIVIDARQGTVVAGGDLTVGPGVVSVGGVTVSIGAAPADTGSANASGALLIRAGSRVQDLAAVLATVRTPAPLIAQIFEALRQAGAISAEVIAR
jgi:flagellar P-ring protein precursor FlgI